MESKGLYATGADKLQEEETRMLASVKAEHKMVMQTQFDFLFKVLIEKTRQDKEFEKRVLLPYKSMERCMKFCSDKAMGIREPSDKEKEAARNNGLPIVTPIGGDMLFEWVYEYFSLDDKKEVEKEEKKKENERKRKEEAKKKAETKKASEVKEKKVQKAAKGSKVSAGRKTEIENQLSLLDLMGV